MIRVPNGPLNLQFRAPLLPKCRLGHGQALLQPLAGAG